MTNQRGVTLTELLIALALGLFTIGAVYVVHLNQVKKQIVQEDVLAMQTNRSCRYGHDGQGDSDGQL